MSVYTKVSKQELTEFLTNYAIGKLVSFQGIEAGIENTNYFVTTTQGEFVLTLFETLSTEELPYFIELMAFLAEHKVPSAHPIADNNNEYLQQLNSKPTVLVQKLNGSSVTEPTVNQCAAVGAMLGKLHHQGQHFTGQRSNSRGAEWRNKTFTQVKQYLTKSDRELLESELNKLDEVAWEKLPIGVIHADLFRDNALFSGEQLTGIIDFYYACNDTLLYDVAVTINDWCNIATGELDQARFTALFEAYKEQRPLIPAEQDALPVMLRAAAIRFWLSRLKDFHFQREGEMTHKKNPDDFKNILLARI